MRILLLGVNHRTVPLDVREAVSFSKAQAMEALPALQRIAGEAVVLSTCNRTEIYATVRDVEKTTARLDRFLADFHGLPSQALSPHLVHTLDADAVRHLFRVASGLDSMIIGESEILGQVRESLTIASEAESVHSPLLGLFHAAVRTGRRTREETEISRNAMSVSSASVRLAKRILGTLEGRRALLVGAGEAGWLVARALRNAGVDELMIANRTRARSESLAEELSGTVVDFESIQSSLENVDIAVLATDAPEFILSARMVSDARRYAPADRKLFIFDLAVPRDVEPSVTHIPNVELFNIDDLSAIAEDNMRDRSRAAAEAEAIVEEEVQRFMRWWDSLDAEPMVRELRIQAEAIRQQELAKALKRLKGLDENQQAVLQAMTRSIVNRVLHDPTMFLKHEADTSELDAARMLFRLWGSEKS
ncbi:MAG: glutamyl-tRNA reductase [Chloroflexi bacterium]|nr:glutamyl-tRNA reductase [Chloroflexota bacterium]